MRIEGTDKMNQFLLMTYRSEMTKINEELSGSWRFLSDTHFSRSRNVVCLKKKIVLTCVLPYTVTSHNRES